MITLDLIQGSQEWHAKRLQCFTASEASAMMGASKYQTRDQLLAAKSTGITEEIDGAKQRLFNRGHDAEAINRPAVEALIEQELYPVTGFSEIEGLPLLASFDGITMDETIIFEHKLTNQNLIASINNGDLEPHYYWQLEQQLLVSGAEKAIFVCGDETGIVASLEYFPVPGRKEQLIAGWHQFAKDLETFVPTAKAEKVVADPVEALPTINYQIDFSNGISINSNLEVFKLAAQELVERSKTKLVSDQDFENAKARVKQCESAEKNITSLVQRVLGELGDVNKFKEDMESIKEWIRQSRLNQDKQIKERLTARKAEIIAAGRKAVADYTALANTSLGRVRLPAIDCDFDGAVYKKSSFASMESAVNDAVASFKIDADKWSAHLIQNLNTFDQLADGYTELFRDLQQLCEKDTDSLKAIVKVRIDEFKVKEQERIEAEAKRIADAKAAKDKADAEAEEKRIAEAGNVEAPAPIRNQDFASASSLVAPAQTVAYRGVRSQPKPILSATEDQIVNVISMHYGCTAEEAESAILRLFKQYLTA